MFEAMEMDGPVTAGRLDWWAAELMTTALPGDNTTRVDMLQSLERFTRIADGVKAAITADFARSERAGVRGEVRRERVDASIATQIGLARGESPHRGRRRVGVAVVLATEMPHTFTALRTGRITEWRAEIIVRETACVTRADRGKIDAAIGADLDRIETLSEGQLRAEIRTKAYEADREVFVRARAQAVKDRRVTVRPLPDGMAQLSATVPLVDGVAAYATLLRTAESARASGDDRSRGAIMADTLLERVRSGPVPAPGSACPAPVAPPVPVAVNLVVSDATVFGGGNEPAQCEHYGPIPAELARELIVSADREGLATLRRVYTKAGAVVAMESTARCFPAGLARMIRVRDRTCRMPYCDAPIRHIDHIAPVARGGPTTYANGQGLCEGCNHAKQPDGWTSRVVEDPSGRHSVEMMTPTGHCYRSTAPAPPRPMAG